MTKRYFYTDPLAAAWMAKHFGMRFCLYDDEGIYMHELHVLPLIDSERGARRYIHPDSLPLLEPKAGDLVYEDDMQVGILAKLFDGDAELATGDWLIKPGHIKITRRNRLSFFWPESEEA